MSPRGTSSAASPSRSSNTPYSRRPSSQPKSSRQQFSACGACRMRRVRCDLKDLPISSAGPHPSCSNCKERGINCIDEFADVKAVKLLRRGRRLQQVEAIYGKTDEQDASPSPGGSGSKQSNSIPTLHADFFTSPFWRWFVIHRPILDPVEFPTRFAAHFKGSDQLGNEGGVIAMLLVTWAASFGLDERGVPLSSKSDSPSEGGSRFSASHPYAPPGSQRTQWKAKAEAYIREIVELVDYHGVLRRPTMDGLRVLLLLLPLLDDAQPLERVAIHEAALSQAHTLCVLSAPHPPTYEESTSRARIFWYAYTQESISTGMRGNRFVLSEDDLEAFQATLPTPNFGAPSSGLHTPPSPSSAREYSSHKQYMQVLRNSSIPLELGKICRRIHSVLTGPRATRRAESHSLVDANGMREIWRDLDRCWQELIALKQLPVELEGSARRMDLLQYVDSWRIFVFECHNVIREGLKHFTSAPGSQSSFVDPSTSRPSSASPYLSPAHLHTVASRRCIALLPAVIRILRAHSPRDHSDIPGIFRWDAGLVKDGCFFAGYLAASLDRDVLDHPGESDKHNDGPVTVDEAVSICLDALSVMRWGYSKSEEREETVRLVWDSRKLRHQGQGPLRSGSAYDIEYGSPAGPFAYSPSHLGLAASGSAPTMLPPLALVPQRRVESAPNTASSTDGRGMNGWPSYTPPGTGTSMSTSNGTAVSSSGDSPIFANMPSFKNTPDDIFYHGANGQDLDHFAYNVSSSVDREAAIPASLARFRPSPPNAIAGTNAANYMAPTFHTPTPPILSDYPSQYGDNSYH